MIFSDSWDNLHPYRSWSEIFGNRNPSCVSYITLAFYLRDKERGPGLDHSENDYDDRDLGLFLNLSGSFGQGYIQSYYS
jgi:hypothetical protein